MVQDHDGDDIVTIPEIGNLHQVIAESIVCLPTKMSGRELRFLRTEMGLTQTQLADVLKVTLLTISRWERDEKGINDAAEMLVRLMSVKRLMLDVDLDVDSVSERVISAPRVSAIHIDGSDPANYHLKKKAA